MGTPNTIVLLKECIDKKNDLYKHSPVLVGVSLSLPFSEKPPLIGDGI